MIAKVCDALPGAGKTVSCINMMNKNTDKRYMFITPYLSEVERIEKHCASRNFIQPEKLFKDGFSKLNGVHELLERGENIVSTHALFSNFTDETKKLIRNGNYTLVLDEVIDLFQTVDIEPGDIDLLLNYDVVKKTRTNTGDKITWEYTDYSGAAFADVQRIAKSKDIISYGESFYFWSLPINTFNCFEDVYVLTYMFEHQMLRYFFDNNKVKYELIGTKPTGDTYNFCPLEEMNRAIDLRELIEVVEDEKLNKIGEPKFALSSNWFKKAADDPEQPRIEELQKNIYNFFRSCDTDADDKIWTTFTKFRGQIKGKGYSNGFVSFNKRATNDYADRHTLAYCINVFLQPWIKNYLQKEKDAAKKANKRKFVKEINQDMYALSILIQWLFRSAIRRGEPVKLYIPSKRMRTLLLEWMDNLAEGRDLKEIHYIIDWTRKRPDPLKNNDAYSRYNAVQNLLEEIKNKK